AHIVDWDQLPNGLLGISIEGKETFRLDGTHSVESGLVVGQVVLNGAVQSEPLLEKWRVLERVLRSLEKHPHVQRMNLTIDFNHAWQVGYSLVQLLPLEESVKYELLGAKSLDNLMAGLDSILNQISPDA
ncbi:MAG: ATP-dependent protease, partial [Halieaceae bacterium]|nr:ATP-dependent protease [Halieaceae bacterium]